MESFSMPLSEWSAKVDHEHHGDGPVTTVHGRTISLEEARRIFEVDPIIRRFGTWAVTEYGVECLTTHYAIEKARLKEPDWLRHLIGKTWTVAADVSDALDFAREHFARPKAIQPTVVREALSRPARQRHSISVRVRFLVLKMYGYRCQLCGATASDPRVELEIDHKIPLSKGGTNVIENLWVLCRPCNSGKTNDSL